MTPDERRFFNVKVGRLLYTALVAVRAATYPPLSGEEGVRQREELNDLADLLHNMPNYITGTDEHAIDSPEQFRAAVVKHVRRFYPNTPPDQHRYVQLLDMDEASFDTQYRRAAWAWPGPAVAAQAG